MVTDAEIELGPIDYLVVEWPSTRQPTGEALPMLVDLADRGLIRILDLGFVHVEDDGRVVGIDIRDLDSEGYSQLSVFDGASSGLLDDDDLEDARQALEAGFVGRAPRLREHVGGAVRDGPPPRRRPARRDGS